MEGVSVNVLCQAQEVGEGLLYSWCQNLGIIDIFSILLSFRIKLEQINLNF
jgi:hypothetical protein